MIKLKNILTKILEVICVIMFAFITNCRNISNRNKICI